VVLFAELKWRAEAKRKEKKNNNKMEERVRGKGKKMEPIPSPLQNLFTIFFMLRSYTKHNRKVAVSD